MRRILMSAALAVLPAGAFAHDVSMIPGAWDDPQGHLVLRDADGSFGVWIYPNIATLDSARAVAIRTAGAYCLDAFDTNKISFTDVDRYADVRISGYMFKGVCR
ncbi:hypothetical protein [Tranquillimonas alkanivorans]|uniref:Uncharacterized protein n=1 Tax=Tranquillimonas alkanivorans TaxID=441119 RepID=A0A1I5SHU4_9RHOB|nr:hypothetical protein [Tranquillimonas alkanivorans]SFP70324.1 hypothetical protein SAMN04488047_11125 [Tranquillimonas alkanivorans]